VPTSVKVKLRRKVNKSGEKGIVIQVIHNRKTTELSINQYVNDKLFDTSKGEVKTKHPRAAKINKVISDERKKIEDIIFELKQSEKSFKLSDITYHYKQQNKPSDLTNPFFRDYMLDFIERNPEGLEFSTLKYYNTSLNKWKKYTPNIRLSSLSEKDILQFRSSLESEGLKPESVYKYIKPIKKLARLAISKKLLLDDPFANVVFKRSKSQRIYLDKGELKDLEKVEELSGSEEVAKDVFLFSAFTGLRFGDMCTLTEENLKKKVGSTRLKILMGKTKEPLEFNLNKQASAIYYKYAGRKKDRYIFPMLDKVVTHSETEIRKKIESQNAYLNSRLKDVVKRAGIKKNISMHIGRHTFAVLSIELGGDLYVISKLLGHRSVVTTEIYAKMVDSRKDELTEMWNKM